MLKKSLLATEAQKFIHTSRYARWLEKENRRENWRETPKRYCDFFEGRFPELFPAERVFNGIYSGDVMPSMRALMTAGPALDRDEMAGYNCSYTPIDDVRAFDEILYILACGTGVGFSVERQFISKLPHVGIFAVDGEIVEATEFTEAQETIVVADSKIGWARAFRRLIALLYGASIPKIDTSRVRPAGSKLKTFGGRASGPEPLEELFRFTIETFKGALGRKLNSIECHDLVCKIGDAIVSGGVRRSALISLSNLSDQRMRGAKNGQWWITNPQRALANNSSAYTEKPDPVIFLDEFKSLIESQSGERGIFNRVAAKKKAKECGRRDPNWEFGTNPCGEIILRPRGLCNLTEIIVRTSDTLDDLKEKVELATIMGTFQSTLVNFRYVRDSWRKNAEQERLLGVSMTGIMDHPVLSKKSPEAVKWLEELKALSIATNAHWAAELGIPASASITTVKPSGTVSQLVDSASGIHPRYSEYYLRTYRNDQKDPVSLFMRDVGFPVEVDVTKPTLVDVFYFPFKAPEASVFRNDMTAIEQLEHYLMFKHHWCEHNPSITVYVRHSEWLEVAAWVYKNMDDIGGISFLPHSDHVYKQAPYAEITKDEYETWLAKMPVDVDWSRLSEFEKEDSTTGSQELACSAGVCELHL